MCRLLGLVGYFDFWRDIVLEFPQLAEYGKGAPHQDGWGIAKANEGNFAMSLVDKQLGSAYLSLSYKNAVESLIKQPQIIFCHMRKASPNISVTLPNAQPFVTERWAFIHNGTIYNAESLPRDSFYKFTSNNSDTEYFFHYLLTKLSKKEKDETELEALSNAISDMTTNFSSLNCMLSNGEDIFVVRWYKKSSNYYTLFYYKGFDNVIICSEPLSIDYLDKNHWEEIPNKSVLRIQRPMIEIEKLSI